MGARREKEGERGEGRTEKVKRGEEARARGRGRVEGRGGREREVFADKIYKTRQLSQPRRAQRGAWTRALSYVAR